MCALKKTTKGIYTMNPQEPLFSLVSNGQTSLEMGGKNLFLVDIECHFSVPLPAKIKVGVETNLWNEKFY